MTGLPKGWAETTLGTLSEYITSGSRDWSRYYSDQGCLFIRTQDIKTNSLDRFPSIARVALPEKVEGKRTRVYPDDILITITGANVGKVAIVPCDIPEAYVSQSVALVRLYLQEQSEYLQKAIMCPQNDGLSALRGAAYGQGRPVLSLADVRDTPIPLPPLAEQRRIVRKLVNLSARSTTARTSLTAIEKLVERYKRLVIGQLCMGGVASQFQDQAELTDLPYGWEWSRAEDLCHWITKGTTPSKEELFAGQGEVPFIKVYNLTFSEKLDFSVEPTFVSGNTHNIALKRSTLFPGDVLINIVGPPLGKTAIVPDDYPEWNMNQAIAVFRPKDRLFSRFLLYWLSSEWFLLWALSRSKATAGQRNLTLEICRDTPIPLPPFEEQREIVRRIESAFSKIDRLAAEAAKALKLLGRLDQRILAKAFAGQLVTQDPNDEPASVMLERIKLARVSATKMKRDRKTEVKK